MQALRLRRASPSGTRSVTRGLNICRSVTPNPLRRPISGTPRRARPASGIDERRASPYDDERDRRPRPAATIQRCQPSSLPTTIDAETITQRNAISMRYFQPSAISWS